MASQRQIIARPVCLEHKTVGAGVCRKFYFGRPGLTGFTSSPFHLPTNAVAQAQVVAIVLPGDTLAVRAVGKAGLLSPAE